MSGLFGDDPINAVPSPKPKRIDPGGRAWLAALAAILVAGTVLVFILSDDDLQSCTSYESDWTRGSTDVRDDLKFKPCASPDGATTTVGAWFGD